MLAADACVNQHNCTSLAADVPQLPLSNQLQQPYDWTSSCGVWSMGRKEHVWHVHHSIWQHNTTVGHLRVRGQEEVDGGGIEVHVHTVLRAGAGMPGHDDGRLDREGPVPRPQVHGPLQRWLWVVDDMVHSDTLLLRAWSGHRRHGATAGASAAMQLASECRAWDAMPCKERRAD